MAPQSQEMSPVDGVTGLLGLFDQFPIVALGEMHGQFIARDGTVTDLAPPTPFIDSALTIADILDGYPYLDPCAAFTYSKPDPALLQDEEYMSEVKRRTALMPGPAPKQLQDARGKA